MARKKKKPTSPKKKDKKKRSAGKSRERGSKAVEAPEASGASAGADVEVEEPAVEPATEAGQPAEQPTEAAAATEPAEQPTETASATEPPAAAEPATTTESVPPERVAEPESAPVGLDEDDVPLIDLDADEEDDPIERLIAEAVAGAMPDEALEPPEPAVDLDDDEGVVAIDEGDDAAPPTSEGPTAAEPGEDGVDSVSTSVAIPAPAAAGPGVEPLPRQEIADEVARRLVDLGPVSTPELRDRLLAEALAHAEHKDARYRIPFSTSAAAGRWKALAATLILLVAGTVAMVPPGWARPEPPAQLAAAERAANLRAALLLQAQQIEAFRVRTQRLPSSLDEVTGTLPGLRYVRSGNRAYQLIVYEPSGEAIVYDSTNPSPAFADVTLGWGGAP